MSTPLLYIEGFFQGPFHPVKDCNYGELDK